MRTSLVFVSLVSLLSLSSLPGSPLSAQLSVGGSTSNFGSTSISPGFTPDPLTVSVVSGGSIAVADLGLGTGCVGYATRQPDYIVNLSERSSRLRVFFEGDGDTGLVINAPDGSWRCNDDGRGLDPIVTFDGATSGQYDIWVSSYADGTSINGTLSITELDYGPGAGPDAPGALEIGGSVSNFGRATLSPGFSPDPWTVSIVSGGSLDVRGMELGAACVGYATARPDYILDYTAGGSLLHLYVEGEGDTALVINDPDGNWWCDDDTEGLDPRVTFKAPPNGQYDIWVASYSSGTSISGVLGITELTPPGGS
ncbi:MAG: hypothetical protein RQ745_01260 [Longimicrobiales bacterium]|nr:hypothetical protein [Longimicrobiales bacterium]